MTETPPNSAPTDGGVAVVSLKVHHHHEGVSFAKLKLPNGGEMVLCTAPTNPVLKSEKVHEAFMALAKAVFVEALNQAGHGSAEVVFMDAPSEDVSH